VKNLPYVWLGILTIAIAFLFFKPSGSAGSGLGASTADGKRIVFVNSDSLLNNYQFYKDDMDRTYGQATTKIEQTSKVEIDVKDVEKIEKAIDKAL
jgi:hypothetical protein